MFSWAEFLTETDEQPKRRGWNRAQNGPSLFDWALEREHGHFLTARYQSEISVLGAYERLPASERLADAFAGCFLMPESGLRRRFSEHSRSTGGSFTAAEVCRMAHYYAVSVEAMMRRLEQIGALPRGAWERLRDRGFKVR